VTVSPHSRNGPFGHWRVALWTLFGALLLVPAAAIPFTAEVRWAASDFLAAAAIFVGVGGAIELVVRLVDRPALRWALVGGASAAGLAIWAEGAVGIF
jgi:hypothetical protein